MAENKRTHLDKETLPRQLEHISSGPVREQDLALLEHVSRCSYCAELLAEQMESDGLLKAPPDLKASVMQEAASLRTRTELTIHKTSARMQLLFYSLRVGGAMLGALVILFLSSLALSMDPGNSPDRFADMRPRNEFSLHQKLQEGSAYVNQILQDFSNQIISMEDTNYDK